MAGKVRNIVVEELVRTPPVEMQQVELVERKGIGHPPDSIADGIAEAVSRALSREYVKRYGIILHHNTDQVEVVGGRAYPQFGGGEIIKRYTSSSPEGPSRWLTGSSSPPSMR